MHTSFSRNGTEWLSSSQIERGLLYLLHTTYQQSKHHNAQGPTHLIATDVQLITKVNEASNSNQLEDNVGIAQVLRDTMKTDGPCPAIMFGDNQHFRNVLINSRTKSVSLVDPMGSGFLDNVKASITNLYSKDTTGDWSITEWKVRLQHDSYSCGVWAMWIHEKWMQYWMQEDANISFEDWFSQQVQDIPPASSLREHYYDQMQQAKKTGIDGKTGFTYTQDISAERMASHRNAQELTAQHLGRISQGEEAPHKPKEIRYFHQQHTAASECGVRGNLHITQGMSHKPRLAQKQDEKKPNRPPKTTSRTIKRKQTASEVLMKSWLQDTTKAGRSTMQQLPLSDKGMPQNSCPKQAVNQSCSPAAQPATLAQNQGTAKPPKRAANIMDMLRSMSRKRPTEQQKDSSLPQKDAT